MANSDTILSRRDQFALRIACALFESPKSFKTAGDKPRPMNAQEVGEEAVEIADAMIRKLYEDAP